MPNFKKRVDIPLRKLVEAGNLKLKVMGDFPYKSWSGAHWDMYYLINKEKMKIDVLKGLVVAHSEPIINVYNFIPKYFMREWTTPEMKLWSGEDPYITYNELIKEVPDQIFQWILPFIQDIYHNLFVARWTESFFKLFPIVKGPPFELNAIATLHETQGHLYIFEVDCILSPRIIDKFYYFENFQVFNHQIQEPVLIHDSYNILWFDHGNERYDVYPIIPKTTNIMIKSPDHPTINVPVDPNKIYLLVHRIPTTGGVD